MFDLVLKFASEFVINVRVSNINTQLSQVLGFDAFARVLERFGYSIGKSFAKNKYFLLQNGAPVEDMYLRGDHEELRVIPEKPKVPKRRIPLDAYWSPGAKYDLEEKNKP
jgi:hypothetical protein